MKARIEITIIAEIDDDPQALANLKGEAGMIADNMPDILNAAGAIGRNEITVTIDRLAEPQTTASRDQMWSGGPGMPYGT